MSTFNLFFFLNIYFSKYIQVVWQRNICSIWIMIVMRAHIVVAMEPF